MAEAAEAAAAPDEEAPSAPSAEEAPLLEQLKANLAQELAEEPGASFPELTGDVRLLRFLRSRDCQVGEAAALFRAHLAWRKEHGVDAIRQRIVDEKMPLDWAAFPRGAEVERHFPNVLHAGFSAHGHLIQLDNMGLVEPEGILGSQEGAVGTEAFDHAFIHMLEIRNKLHDDLSRETGKMIRTCQIRDLEQVGVAMVSKANMAFSKRLVNLSQDNYPESMAKIVFINAGTIFSMVMAVIRPILTERTLSRFLVLNTDAEPELLEAGVTMSAVQRLAKLAQRARHKVGGMPSVEDGGGSLSVAARYTADALLPVEPASVVSWEWKVEAYDVAFGVQVLYDDGQGWREVGGGLAGTAEGELTAAGVSVGGSYTATAPGVLRLRWDNTHALLRSKTVVYSVRCESASEEGVPPSKASEEEEPEMMEPEPAPEPRTAEEIGGGA